MKFKEFEKDKYYHDHLYNDEILTLELLPERVVAHSIATGRMIYIWESVFDEKRFELVKDEK